MNTKFLAQGIRCVFAFVILGSMSMSAFAQSTEYRRGYDQGYRDGYEAKNRNDQRGESAERLLIEEANYGVRNETCNAQDALQRAVGGRYSISIPVDNRLCGDPAPDRPKRLDVVYRCGEGPVFRARADEGTTITLNCREQRRR